MSSTLVAMKENTRRNDITVKIDAEVAHMSRVLASFLGIPLVEFMSDELRSVCEDKFKSLGIPLPPSIGKSKKRKSS